MNKLTKVSKGTGKKTLSSIKNLDTLLYRYSLFNYVPDEVYSLSQTSKAMYAECKLPLAGKKLLSHIVRAEEALALKMINANPELLLYTSEATDYSNRTYSDYTPFQTALLCHDVTLWKKMEPYFDRLPGGQREKAKQVKILFPTGILQRTAYDFNVLTQTITHSSVADINAALQKKQNDTAICNALNQFRSNFKALTMQETFFNPSHLIKRHSRSIRSNLIAGRGSNVIYSCARLLVIRSASFRRAMHKRSSRVSTTLSKNSSRSCVH